MTPKLLLFQHIAAGHYTTYMTDEFIDQRFGKLDPGRLDQAGTTGCISGMPSFTQYIYLQLFHGCFFIP